MGDHARGDCEKVICSSEEEERQQEVFRNSLYFTPTAVMMSQLNLHDKRIPLPGTSGEACSIPNEMYSLAIRPDIYPNYFAKPAVPTPPTADDTDRQFWAEDELSSSESRLRLVCKQRRRHSLAYRNRTAVRKRSRSLLCQSSSSNSDLAAHQEIVSSIRHNVQRRLRCNHREGLSATKKSKGENTVPSCGTSTPRSSLNSKIPNSSTVGGSFQFGIQTLNSRRRMQTSYTTATRRRSRNRNSQTPSLACSSNGIFTMNELIDIDKSTKQNPRLPPRSKRK